MKELKGKFSTAKVFTDTADYETISQIKELLNSHLSNGSKVRIMPDTHAGKDNVIGLTMTLNDKIAPNLIGSDIGCGISLMPLATKNDIDLKRFDEVIHDNIPYGYLKREKNIKDKNVYPYLEIEIENLKCSKIIDVDYLKSITKSGLATLGGGNHFIELYKNDEGNYFLSIHTGSRTLGGVVYKHYQKKAKNKAYETFLEERQHIIKEHKENGKEQEISIALEQHKKEYLKMHNTDKSIKYLSGQDMEDYLHDMKIVQEYARYNRFYIAHEIISYYGGIAFKDGDIDKPHNYIDVEYKILRKGSQSGLKNEDVIIPINMRDGVIVGKALGNEDWNYSVPHGAGRVLSRSQAKAQLNVKDFENDMKGIYSTTVGIETLDEAPSVYKPINEILENIKGNVEVKYILKPIYNFKGGKEYKTKEN